MNAPALTRRESLWAGVPMMRDGRTMDIALKTVSRAASIQEAILSSLKSETPDAWLGDAEKDALELLEHIRSMRAVLK